MFVEQHRVMPRHLFLLGYLSCSIYCGCAGSLSGSGNKPRQDQIYEIFSISIPKISERGNHKWCRVKTECGGTRAETIFGLSVKWTSPFISAGVSVQSAASSRSMRISGSNAG